MCGNASPDRVELSCEAAPHRRKGLSQCLTVRCRVRQLAGEAEGAETFEGVGVGDEHLLEVLGTIGQALECPK
jgi:hypothetical protein